jgi:cytochrome P450
MTVAFDAYDPHFLADPYPTYQRIRDESPVFHDDEWNLTFVARHDSISSILKDRSRFGRDFRHRLEIDDVEPSLYRRLYPPQWPTWTRYIRESFIDLEPPRHTRLRRLVSKALSRRSSESFRPALDAAAERLVTEALEAGKMEAITHLATPIPLLMIADLMGIRDEDHPRLVKWSNDIVKVFDKNVSYEDGEAAERATRDFVAFIEGQIAIRRANRGTDLISTMIDVEESGDTLNDEEIVATSILTLNAGHEATVHAIGNAVLALSANPDQFQRLRDGEVDVATAADELLRFDSPLQMFERWVLEDGVSVEGAGLTKGSKVGLLFGSGNHDPEIYGPTADVLDLGRTPNPHLSFGAGLHFCVGAPLARIEIEAALQAFADLVKSFEVESTGARIESLVFRGVDSIQLSLQPA